MVKSKYKDFSKAFLNIVFDTSIFRIVFLLDLFFFSVAFFDHIARFLHIIIMVWGAVVLINNFFVKRNIKKICYYKILFLFIISASITVITHITSRINLSLLDIYVMFLCFFVFYGMYAERSKQKIEEEMYLFFRIIVFITTVVLFAGLIFIFIRVQDKVQGYWIGIYANRLIGFSTNSNLLALFCVVSMIGTHIIVTGRNFRKNKNYKKQIIFYIFNVIISFISLVLSDSNGAFIFLLIYIIVIMFHHLFSGIEEITSKHILKRATAILLTGVILTFGSFSLRGLCQNEIAVILNDMHKIEEPIHDNKIEGNKKNDLPFESIEFGRVIGEDNYDGSSGRVTLIKQAFTMFQKNPIMGVGRSNLELYGKQYIEGGLKFPDFHNGYLTILVAWGLVGLSIFATFSVLIALRMGKILLRINNYDAKSPFPKLFATLVAYCVYSLVEITLLSDLTFTIFIFWAVLGYASTYMIDFEKNYTNTI